MRRWRKPCPTCWCWNRHLEWYEGEKAGFYWYHRDTYQNEGPLEGLKPECMELLNRLYRDYEMDTIWFDEGEIGFEIAEDALIYITDPEQPPDHSEKLSDRWYHFWFEYGI